MNSDQRVRYTGAKDGSWTWPGIARVVQLDGKRQHFGPKMGTPGPALLLSFEHNGLTLWARPEEVEAA